MVMLGHVTSSYFSPNVGRSIAMAVVKNGRNRMGDTVFVPLPNRTIHAKVVGADVLRSRSEAHRWFSPICAAARSPIETWSARASQSPTPMPGCCWSEIAVPLP